MCDSACRLFGHVLSLSSNDVEFIRRSSEQDMIQLFQLYDSLLEQRQELENKLDDAEDTHLPLVPSSLALYESSLSIAQSIYHQEIDKYLTGTLLTWSLLMLLLFKLSLYAIGIRTMILSSQELICV